MVLFALWAPSSATRLFQHDLALVDSLLLTVSNRQIPYTLTPELSPNASRQHRKRKDSCPRDRDDLRNLTPFDESFTTLYRREDLCPRHNATSLHDIDPNAMEQRDYSLRKHRWPPLPFRNS